MSTTQEKVELLEAELRAYQTRRGLFDADNHRVFISIWAALSFLFLVFMVVFKPGFVQHRNAYGELKISKFLLLQWFMVFTIFMMIALFIFYHCRRQR